MLVKKRFWLVNSIVFLAINTGNTVNGQIARDLTTPNTDVVGNCATQCQITGGILAGSNLFHSFEEFNVGTGESIYFADPGVTNIFSRVTGKNLSRIAGTLGVSGGDANLFLLNPNGIIFGGGATLDLHGSFVATTADEIEFGDRGKFSANPNGGENLALLTVNPTAFFFNQMGQNNPITTEAGAKLTLTELENIVFLGGDILLEGTTVEAPEGKIELGAVGRDATIAIDEEFQLTFPDDVIKRDIWLKGGSAIDVSGVGSGSVEFHGKDVKILEASRIIADTLGDRDGGEINFQVNNLAIEDNSFISVGTFASGNGGNINVFANDSVKISGESIAALQQFLAMSLSGEIPAHQDSSTLNTTTYSTGSSGNIVLQAKQLELNNGAWIANSTIDSGVGGKITIDANSININGSGIFNASAANQLGVPGNIEITTEDLLIQNSGVISASTLGEGSGGNLEIAATESVRLQTTFPGTIVPTGIYSNTILGSGKAGDVTIDTKQLIVRDGSQISSASGLISNDIFIPLGGAGGNIDIQAAEVKIEGSSSDGIFFSRILSDTLTHNSAGNLNINTEKLFLQNLGLISASSLGTGDGGNIEINASKSIQLKGSGVGELQQIIIDGLSGQLDLTNLAGGLLSIAVNGGAGDITLNTPNLNIFDGAIVSTASFGDGNAGDLTINVPQEVRIIGSAIASPTLGNGDAGQIFIDTEKLSILEGGVIATATLSRGKGGDLTINATESVEVSGVLLELLFSGNISTGSYGGQALPGDLTINTKNLIVRDGSTIDTINTVFPGLPIPEDPITLTPGGEVTINASKSIELSGSSLINGSISSISSTTTTAAPASNIKIMTDRLSISDNAQIAVNSVGAGAAGSLEIWANSIALEHGGNLNATTLSGRGGNINLQIADMIYLSDRSSINTNAMGEGNGGNIEIDTNFVVATDFSTVTSRAIAGRGGNINISVKDLLITPDSYVSASSELGIDGEVNIRTFTLVDRNSLSNLPEAIANVENSIVQQCGSTNNGMGKFTYVGRGGLPSSPLNDFPSENMAIADMTIPQSQSISSFSQPKALQDSIFVPTSQEATIVEARGWMVNSNGNIVLTAQTSDVNSTPNFHDADCPWKQ